MTRATFEPFTDRQKATITEAFARTDIYDNLAKNNMKTYVITLSKKFPVNHNRKGQPTDFGGAFLKGQGQKNSESMFSKIHTIRANYPLWEKRIQEVQQGTACLSIRQWTDKPYRSKQIEIARLTKDNGVGIQKLQFRYCDSLSDYAIDDLCMFGGTELANNDGLRYRDWANWFSSYDLTKPIAIIHFTQFRY